LQGREREQTDNKREEKEKYPNEISTFLFNRSYADGTTQCRASQMSIAALK